MYEVIGALLQMPEQFPVAFRLALLGAAEDGVELAHRLARQDALQEYDSLTDMREIRMKIGAREAEEDADRALIHHHGVDDDAALRVLEREDEWPDPSGAGDPADHIGARHLKEHRADEFDLIDLQRRLRGVRIGFDLSRALRS